MFKQIFEKIAGETKKAPAPEKVKKEKKGGPEERVEELYALWLDYQRMMLAGLKSEKQKKLAERRPLSALKEELRESPRAKRMRQEIAERWNDPAAQDIFKLHVERSFKEQEESAAKSGDYNALAKERDKAVERRDAFYCEIFSRRNDEMDELAKMDLVETGAAVEAPERAMRNAENIDPKLAAQLSFERLKKYRAELDNGFVWTPSREKIYSKLLEQATLLNRNRPLVLVGETGTGKTELVRALSRRLTGAEPARTTARDQGDPGRTLGFRSLNGVEFGSLGQALTGKESATQEKAGLGRIAFIDEANKYPEDFIRMLVKTLAGKKPGEKICFDEWFGKEQALAANGLLVMSMNLPDAEAGRHLDRPDFSPEVKRELAPTTTIVEYIPQTADNPELFEILLAAALDKNGRIRMPKEWIAPEYEEAADEAVKNFKINKKAEAGGALWRFANLIAESQRLYQGSADKLPGPGNKSASLEHAVLDVGVAIGWIEEYKKKAGREKISLQAFLADKLDAWIGKDAKGGQYLFPTEDRKIFHKLLDIYRLNRAAAEDPNKADAAASLSILSPAEIGALSPRVPRTPEMLFTAPQPIEHRAYLADDSEILYQPEPVQNIMPGSRLIHRKDKKKFIWQYLGKTAEGLAVLQGEDVALVKASDLARDYELVKSRLQFVEKVRDPKTKKEREVRLDFEQGLQTAVKFYKEHNIKELADALPREVKLSAGAEKKIRAAMRGEIGGLICDRLMILPAADAHETLPIAKYKTELADNLEKDKDGKPIASYMESGVESLIMEPAEKQKRRKAYAVLYSSAPVPKDTKGLTYIEAEKLFKEKGWDGMSYQEMAIIGRKEFEENGNHDFNTYNNDAQKSNWTWCLASRAPSGCVDVYFNPGVRQVRALWISSDDSVGTLGARPAVVVEIEL